MAAPIQSVKHYVQTSSGNIASGVAEIISIVVAVSRIAGAVNSTDVIEGSIVKAVFIERWIIANAVSGNIAQFNMIIEKLSSGQVGPTFTQTQNLGSYPNKKNILYVTQGIVATDQVGQPIPIIRNWVMIPKGKQRMGLGDQIIVTISNIATDTLQRCGISTYKEYN